MIARRGPITHPLYSNIRNNLKWVIKQEEEEEESPYFPLSCSFSFLSAMRHSGSREFCPNDS